MTCRNQKADHRKRWSANRALLTNPSLSTGSGRGTGCTATSGTLTRTVVHFPLLTGRRSALRERRRCDGDIPGKRCDQVQGIRHLGRQMGNDCPLRLVNFFLLGHLRRQICNPYTLHGDRFLIIRDIKIRCRQPTGNAGQDQECGCREN